MDSYTRPRVTAFLEGLQCVCACGCAIDTAGETKGDGNVAYEEVFNNRIKSEWWPRHKSKVSFQAGNSFPSPFTGVAVKWLHLKLEISVGTRV